MTESDRKLFREAKELELQSWLDHRVLDLVKKICLLRENYASKVDPDMEIEWISVCWAFKIQI